MKSGSTEWVGRSVQSSYHTLETFIIATQNKNLYYT